MHASGVRDFVLQDFQRVGGSRSPTASHGRLVHFEIHAVPNSTRIHHQSYTEEHDLGGPLLGPNSDAGDHAAFVIAAQLLSGGRHVGAAREAAEDAFGSR